jgi:uncharacterized delta-60 repeat protein
MADLRIWLRNSIGVIAAVTATFCASANDGAYDPAFGNGGRSWTDALAASDYDFSAAMVRLPNGTLAMFGGCGYNPSPTCAAWLTPSGTLASGYGVSGSGTATFASFAGWPLDGNSVRDAAAFTDGRVALTAYKPNSPTASYLAILRADGSGLDPAAANGAGFVTAAFDARYVRVTPQQQIIVAGQAGTPRAFVVARYDAQLHLDTNFGNAGYAVLGFTGHAMEVSGMTLQRDGKIVVIGTDLSYSPQPEAVAVVRFTANGLPDPDFGSAFDGRFENAFDALGSAGRAIVEDKKGRLVFVGFVNTSALSGTKWLVGRLTSGGAVDPAFNGGQPHKFTIFDSSEESYPTPCCVALQSDNRILAAGSMNREPNTTKFFAMARFTVDGAFDSTWGVGGQSYGDMSPQTDTYRNDSPASMVLVPGGVVVGGYTSAGDDTQTETRFSATAMRVDLLFAADFE